MSNPRVPHALKMLRGTERPDRANPAEPRPGSLPKGAQPPTYLKLSPLARRAWRDILPILQRLGVVTTADPVALALLCSALADLVAARAVVDAEGPTYWTVGETRMLRTRPEVAIAADAWRRAKIMLGEFGLTPATRARVAGTPVGEGDSFEKWLSS